MDHPDRPGPEELLTLSREVAPTGRGSLRVYLGMCPGVGKTFAMLNDARRLGRENGDFLVGVVETHGRPETAALLEGLPVLERREIAYRGTVLHEFDLDAAIRSGAALVLVDELAHTNAPGSRHPKRWQDVEELLAAGIDVWTTLNIQHVESVLDAVRGVTGIRVQETVPDAFLAQADEIRVIDLTPEELLQRLAEGKVYLAGRAAIAADSFFREGNLRALREMALRFTVRKADAEKRAFMRRHFISGPWRAGERFLVAVGTGPHSERLIRITCRLAQAQDAGWVAVHVDTGRALSEDESRQLTANLTLARSLGGETVSYPCEDLVQGILHVARRENVTQIVAGKAAVSLSWESLLRRGIADRLQRESGEIDLLLVHPGGEGRRSARPQGLSVARSDFGHFGLAAAMLVVVTLVGLLMEPLLGYRSAALLYILSVPVAGIFLPRWPLLAMALCASLAWNFFFTEPRYTFAMAREGDVIILLSSLVVALVIGHLTTRLRRREANSRLAEERSRALYELTRVAAASPSLAHSVNASLAQLESVFSCRVTLLADSSDGRFQTLGGGALSGKEESVCRWALEHGQAAGRFTDTLPEAGVLALPLSVNGKQSAVLALRPSDDQLASPVARDLLETFAAHFSVMLEKEEYLRMQREAALTEKSRQFQRTLLDHVSHEIKTPVAIIQAAADQLLKGAPHQELIAEMREAAQRLNRVMSQLVTLSRAEAGLILPAPELCDAHDVVREAMERLAPAEVSLHGETFTFRTDPSILETILFNLMHNATRHGGGRADTHCGRANGRVFFEIRNTGEPIPEAERGRIFERFHRGSGSGPGGMGLGLPIAKEFARLLGGDVKLLRSDPDASVFRVDLPDLQDDAHGHANQNPDHR